MTDFRGFKGAAKPRDDIDLPKLAARIGAGLRRQWLSYDQAPPPLTCFNVTEIRG